MVALTLYIILFITLKNKKSQVQSDCQASSADINCFPSFITFFDSWNYKPSCNFLNQLKVKPTTIVTLLQVFSSSNWSIVLFTLLTLLWLQLHEDQNDIGIVLSTSLQTGLATITRNNLYLSQLWLLWVYGQPMGKRQNNTPTFFVHPSLDQADLEWSQNTQLKKKTEIPSFSIPHLPSSVLYFVIVNSKLKKRENINREYLLGSLWSNSLVVGINAVCDGISAADEWRGVVWWGGEDLKKKITLG